MPTGLTPYQLDMVRLAARELPHEWRGRFLEAVVDRIMPTPWPTDAAVNAAISAALALFLPVESWACREPAWEPRDPKSKCKH